MKVPLAFNFLPWDCCTLLLGTIALGVDFLLLTKNTFELKHCDKVNGYVDTQKGFLYSYESDVLLLGLFGFIVIFMY